MLHSTLSFCTLLIIAYHVSSLQEDYYWREYTGSIPVDAVIGGKDVNGKNVYIGQAYVKDGGLIVVQIYPGVREVHVPLNGIKKVDKYIKILCGPQVNFNWMSANSSDLHVTLIDKHAVFGGHEDGQGQINIGRISHGGETKIGKINSFNPGSAFLFFNDNGAERHLKSFEILLYNSYLIDVRIDN